MATIIKIIDHEACLGNSKIITADNFADEVISNLENNQYFIDFDN